MDEKSYQARFLKVTAFIGFGLAALVAAWVLWTFRGDSDYEQAIGWAFILGAATAGAVFLIGIIVAVLATPGKRRR